jgi:hypothetical protein
MSRNGHRLTIDQFLEQDRRTMEEICEAVQIGEENAPALCDEGCDVEPDGVCPHGCPSILRAAGMMNPNPAPPDDERYRPLSIARVLGSRVQFPHS